MTREEAIKRFETLLLHVDTDCVMGMETTEAINMAISALEQPEIIRCKDCRWGKEVCGNIECFIDINVPPEYHGYEWYCPNGERREE